MDRVSEQELRKFEREWTENMSVYWRERMERLRIIDTGALHSSLVGILHPGSPTIIEHSFLVYGKYVSEGVGRNFLKSKQADGTIPFLLPGGEDYRRENRLDRPRRIGPAWRRSRNSPGDAANHEAGGRPMKYNPVSGKYEERDWFFKKYASSRVKLNDFEAAYYGRSYNGLLAEGIDELFKTVRVL
jgi:hypothetical protein